MTLDELSLWLFDTGTELVNLVELAYDEEEEKYDRHESRRKKMFVAASAILELKHLRKYVAECGIERWEHSSPHLISLMGTYDCGSPACMSVQCQRETDRLLGEIKTGEEES